MHTKCCSELRHRWEMPLIWASAIATLLALIFAAGITMVDDQELTQVLDEEDTKALREFAGYAGLILLVPLLVFFQRFYMIAKAKANAIRVGPNQFPELWDMYMDLAKKLDMDVLPKLYVTNGNGVVNAYALSCNTRYKYIVLHSEVVLRIKDNPDTVRFVLAHEMAHHKLGHVSLWRIAIGTIPNLLPPLGASTTRAQEYSADRVAKAVCAQDHGAMKLLSVGPWLENEVNSEAWVEQCDEEKDELYVRAANIMSDHAVLTKRYKALRDIDQNGFEKHGEMF